MTLHDSPETHPKPAPTVNPALAAYRRRWHRWHMDLYDAMLFARAIPRTLAALDTPPPPPPPPSPPQR